MKIVHPHSKFFIIGNADEQHSIAEKISEDDIVIRFNSLILVVHLWPIGYSLQMAIIKYVI